LHFAVERERNEFLYADSKNKSEFCKAKNGLFIKDNVIERCALIKNQMTYAMASVPAWGQPELPGGMGSFTRARPEMTQALSLYA
jgi:hypothetical protein